MKVQDKLYVRFSYRFLLEDGNVAYTSNQMDPPWYIHGQQLIMPAMEQAMDSQEQGTTTTIKLEPKNAFGERLDALIKEVDRSTLSDDIELTPGLVLQAEDKEGKPFPIVVLEVNDDKILVDGNHPLAGKEIGCEIHVLEVREPTINEKSEVANFVNKSGIKSSIEQDGSITMEFGPDDDNADNNAGAELSTVSGCSSCKSCGDDPSGCGSD